MTQQMLGRMGNRSGFPAANRDVLRGRRYWLFIHYLTDDQTNKASSGPRLGSSAASEEEEADGPSKRRRLEAALFLSRDGVSSRKLAKLAGLADATEARTLIRELNEEYDLQGRAYRVEDVAGGYMLLTRSQFSSWLRRLAHVPAEKRMSQSAMETLAIVAYRQPVLRVDVEAIRGVGCSETLKQLMELDLVRITGRSEELGRPYLYGTTRRFLQMFGLRSADRLPRRAWVNELQMVLTSSDLAGFGSGAKESTVIDSLTNATALEELSPEELLANELCSEQKELRAGIDDDDDEFFEEDDFEEDDDEDDVDDFIDDDDDDEDIDDDDEDDDGVATLDDDEDEDEDDEEENEWEEVDDDDDGWDDDDDDEEDDDWEEDDDDDEDWD